MTKLTRFSINGSGILGCYVIWDENGHWCVADEADAVIEQLQSRVVGLEEIINKYENGYKGSCYACETVGETNEKLQARIDRLKSAVEEACYFLDVNLDEDWDMERGKPGIKRIVDAYRESPQVSLNKIIADGIKEMLKEFDMEEMPDCEGQYLSVNMMYYYADKLREGEDGQ